MIVRYACPLTEQQRALLESMMKNDASHRARMRAHGLLLSSEGITIKAIAKIYHVDRDTVSTWIKKWEKWGDKSLHDQPRSGRPPTLNATEKELAQQYIKEEPRSLKNVVERLAQKTAKRLSISSLKRLAKKARLRWKRVRKSLKSLRDPIAFAQCQRELEALQKQEDQGKIDLYPFVFEQSVHTGVVIACFEEFSKTLKKKTVVVMDNASVHTSEEFEECLPQWKKKGLIIKYLTPYSPELNLIEILWRNIKYAWLPFSAYQCLNALRDALENILKNFGSKYQITFA